MDQERKINSASALEHKVGMSNAEIDPQLNRTEDGSEGTLKLEEFGARNRRSTMQFPVAPFSPTEEPEVIRLKSVDGYRKRSIELPGPQVVHSSYPDRESETATDQESAQLQEVGLRTTSADLANTTGSPIEQLPTDYDPYERVIREGDSQLNSAVSPMQKSTETTSGQISKLSIPKIRSPLDSNAQEQHSAWSEGENLIEEYGYVSPQGLDSDDKSPVDKDASKGTDLDTLNSYSKYKLLKGSNRYVSTASEHPLTSAASMAGIASKRGSVSQIWTFGDVDGLERASARSSKSEFSFGKASVRKYTVGSSRRTVPDTGERKKSVEFEDEKEPLPEGPVRHHYQYQLTMSPWTCGLLGFLILFLFGYAAFVSVKAFSPLKVGRDEVDNYFENMDEVERFSEVNRIFNDYTSGKAKDSNGSSLMFNDSSEFDSFDDKESINTFLGINEKYREDNEIRSLMEDDRLKQTFYGLSYAPRGVIEPMCQATQRDVLLDIALLSRVTTRVRTYGTQCRQAELILNAFKELNVNMSLALGVWIGSDDHTNWKQLNEMKWLLTNFPRRYFNSIIIGNEVMFRQEKTVRELMAYVEDVKGYLKTIGYGDIPVGTSELGSQIKSEMVQTCDFVGANIHPFFGGGKVKDGVNWTVDYLEQQVAPFVQAIKPETKILVTEVGWPTGGGTFIESVAGGSEMQQFLEAWTCSPKTQNFGWYYFEAFDEPWKKIWHEDGSKWETQWGFFTHDRKMKPGIVLPDCASIANISTGYWKNVSSLK
ncbi:hypothetical protein OGAPHI_004336 [Ogataea philodendri]|uniref:glucan endo-1,3-beta-D-glucosidase n=1 Tax=Ogataea philodendri TaxID=1378263 RepID=A0A9P8P7C1_9ASCO|nr:uncharacterized protein OGAPHI_004336 [Ogataea philodendri]KAH3666147.1 hypothetical protein OGAPHI_004336 [Ogataea philodendri]